MSKTMMSKTMLDDPIRITRPRVDVVPGVVFFAYAQGQNQIGYGFGRRGRALGVGSNILALTKKSSESSSEDISK